MSEYGKTALLRALKLLHYLVCIALFCCVWFLLPPEPVTPDEAAKDLTFPAVYAVLLLLLLRAYRAYDLMLSPPGENFFSQLLSQLLSCGILYLLVSLHALHPVRPYPFLIPIFLQLPLDLLWCALCSRFYRQLFPVKRTAVICRSQADLHRAEALQGHPCRFEIVRRVAWDSDDVRALLPLIADCDAVFVAGVPATARNAVMKYCALHSIDIFFTPHIGDILLSGAHHLQMSHVPILRVCPACPTPEYRFCKRAMDILLSLLGLILLSPWMLITAAAVKLCDGGPVFYRQIRLTKGGKPFRILKFRSMRPDAEDDGVARLACDADPRVTPVGRVLRACRMDEVPQLLNILKGDMSLVGPRPERPQLAKLYEQTLPEFPLRLQVKAGLTGYAQIYGCYGTTPYDKLEMDLIYISKMSMALDIRLILATVKVLFSKDSAGGIGPGQSSGAR